jgi:hypothetical protein
MMIAPRNAVDLSNYAGATIMRLTGFEAITFAERESLRLNKLADSVDDEAQGLSIAEAEAIAVDNPELIYLDVADAEYMGGPRNMEPER